MHRPLFLPPLCPCPSLASGPVLCCSSPSPQMQLLIKETEEVEEDEVKLELKNSQWNGILSPLGL